MTAPARKNWEKVVDALWKVAATVGMLAAGLLIGLDKRVSIIESNRFTAEDAQNMERRILNQLPPDWLREDMAALKRGQADLRDRMIRLETLNGNGK